jgi:plastocyanin domain-containing protein
MKRSSFTIVAAAALLFAALAWCAEWKEKRVEAAIGPDGVQRIEILAGGYYYDPNVIVVKVNVPVELVVKRTRALFGHNIVLNEPDAGIDFEQALGTKPVSIAFTPTKVGKYTFLCSHKIPFSKSHLERGMYGYLEVVD